MFDQLKEENVFSKLDLRFKYHQIRIKEANIPKMPSRLNMGIWIPIFIIGLTNAPTVFMRFMNDICQKFLLVLIKAILVYSKNEKEH